jgi:hypothetical protein
LSRLSLVSLKSRPSLGERDRSWCIREGGSRLKLLPEAWYEKLLFILARVEFQKLRSLIL